MATGVTIASLDWGNRTPDKFIDSAVKNANVLNMFTLIDGVKSKVQVPIFDGTLAWGDDFCTFDPQSTASIDEKEMTVSNLKWGFQNCKESLQTSYRSVLLKKGANNAETMDADFGTWVYDRFSKLASQKIVEVAATEIKTELAADADVIDDVHGLDITEANILTAMAASYKKLSSSLLNQLFGGADRENKPAFFINAKMMQYYQLAIAAKYTTVYDGWAEGNIMPYLGMDIHLFSTLADSEYIITNPSNLVMIVDDYADVNAINAEYEAKVSSDYLWGQFTIGFSYLKGEDIVWARKA